MARSRDSHRELVELLSAKEMIVVCGSGGTGKTTIAAALGAQAAAVVGGRVLVLTVDPARRLATALGLGVASLGNTAVKVPPAAFADAGLECRGELWVAMLDTKSGWDELIRRHAPDAKLRDTVLANPLYRNITGRFVNSHDYLAMEQLYDLHASGEYDLVVIDTPPSRNALDLLDAPGRMREFFGSRLLKWLTVPYRSRLFTMASKPFYQVADRILGSRFLQDIAEFFVLFQTMEAGFVARAKEVERLLTDEGTAFIVVSTLEAAPAREARFLADELHQRRMPLGALVLNRTLPG
ncbi:MAG TPA: ArsA-related P-loop ATPase, partial [Ilumatobacteraceae bacterium]|nr:ArsA-related P-loop ATPase [Ilumatobacteraceae bacterium]